MTLRKITFDNSVNYIPQSEETQERDNTPNTFQKKTLFLVKKNKKLSQNNKNYITYVAGEGFGLYKRSMNCYF